MTRAGEMRLLRSPRPEFRFRRRRASVRVGGNKMQAGDVDSIEIRSLPMPNALIITAVEDKEKRGNRLPGLSRATLSACYSFAINEISSEGTAWLVFANHPGAQARDVSRECQFTTFCNLLLCCDIAQSSHCLFST